MNQKYKIYKFNCKILSKKIVKNRVMIQKIKSSELKKINIKLLESQTKLKIASEQIEKCRQLHSL